MFFFFLFFDDTILNIARIAKRCPSKISSVVNMLKLFLLKMVTITTVTITNVAITPVTITNVTKSQLQNESYKM